LQLKKLKMRAQPGAQGLLMFNISIKGQTFKALIDSGANGLFISSRVASQLKLPTVVKD
jgi:predicted aspartyl protease